MGSGLRVIEVHCLQSCTLNCVIPGHRCRSPATNWPRAKTKAVLGPQKTILDKKMTKCCWNIV